MAAHTKLLPNTAKHTGAPSPSSSDVRSPSSDQLVLLFSHRTGQDLAIATPAILTHYYEGANAPERPSSNNIQPLTFSDRN